eukprot:s652_g3.t1
MLKHFDNLLLSVRSTDPILAWTVNYALPLNETIRQTPMDSWQADDARSPSLQTMLKLEKLAAPNLLFHGGCIEDSKSFRRPFLLPVDLDSRRSTLDVAWYMALAEAAWAPWPTDIKDTEDLKTLQQFGAFDGWIGYTTPSTSHLGRSETSDQAHVMTFAAGDLSPKPPNVKSSFPNCLKEESGVGCNYRSPKMKILQFGFSALQPSEATYLKMEVNSDIQQSALREVWQNRIGEKNWHCILGGVVIDQWADDWDRCAAQRGLPPNPFSQNIGGICDDVASDKRRHLEWYGLSAQYDSFGTHCIDVRFLSFGGESWKGFRFEDGMADQQLESNELLKDPNFSGFCHRLMPTWDEVILIGVGFILLVLIWCYHCVIVWRSRQVEKPPGQGMEMESLAVSRESVRDRMTVARRTVQLNAPVSLAKSLAVPKVPSSSTLASESPSSSMASEVPNSQPKVKISMKIPQQLGGPRTVVDPALASALQEAGWSVTKLGALNGVPSEVMDSIVLGLELVNPDLKVNLNEFEALIEAADAAAESIWAAHGGMSDADLAMTSRLERSKRRLDTIRRLRVEEINEKVPRKGTAPRDVWPTRLSKRLAEAGDNVNLRAEVEDSERNKWIKELQHLVGFYRGGPSDGRGGISRRVGKGRRAGTLRKHVKTWQRFMDWLSATFDASWPEDEDQVALHLEARAGEPCGKSVPLSIFKTLIFMEHAAEVPLNRQLNKKPGIKNAMEEIALQLEQRDPKERKQARLLPMVVIAAMEEAVMNRDLGRFVRGYAWYRLLKLWGAMRFHDTLGIDFGSIHVDEYGLQCTLKRAKTTGPGKKVSLVKVFVGFDAWLAERNWLSEGWKLWKAMAAENMTTNRDYFMQLPRKGLENAQNRMASYSAAASMSQALFKVLKVPRTEEHLLEPGASTVWSEHSERVTLRTWGGSSGLPENICKRLGRWTPTVDQAYDRSVRMQIVAAQEFMADFLKRNSGRADPLDEEAVVNEITRKLRDRGLGRRVLEVQASKLITFRATGAQAVRKSWALGRVGPVGEDSEPQVSGVFSPEFVSESEDEDDGIRPADEPADGQTRMGHYVVSLVGKSRTKTLHRVWDCFRQPGVHYRDFESYGDEVPSPDKYHRSCKTCFPRSGGGRQPPGEEEESSGSETVSSSSDLESSEDEE